MVNPNVSTNLDIPIVIDLSVRLETASPIQSSGSKVSIEVRSPLPLPSRNEWRGPEDPRPLTEVGRLLVIYDDTYTISNLVTAVHGNVWRRYFGKMLAASTLVRYIHGPTSNQGPSVKHSSCIMPTIFRVIKRGRLLLADGF